MVRGFVSANNVTVRDERPANGIRREFRNELYDHPKHGTCRSDAGNEQTLYGPPKHETRPPDGPVEEAKGPVEEAMYGPPEHGGSSPVVLAS